MAQFPKIPDKPRKAFGGSGLVLKNYNATFVLPKWKPLVPPVYPLILTNGFRQSHPADDWNCNKGEYIYAVLEGTIEQVSYGYSGGYGNVIFIRHDGGWQTLYAHLNEIFVKDGEQVKQKQIIGTCGNTGRVFPAPTKTNPNQGSHLHFSIISPQSVYVNPIRYFSQ